MGPGVRLDDGKCSRVARRPSFANLFAPSKKQEGAGKAGCALHPRSRVHLAQESAHTSIQVQRRTPGFPCAVVYGLSRAHPGEPSSVATIAREKRLSRTWRQLRAPDPHAFAVRLAR